MYKKTPLLTAFIQLIIAGILASSNLLAQSSLSKPLPNIIFIYADDLGYGELGCYGQEKIKTPNLDRMAKEGMRFTQFYTGAPVCAPARCMLMTGKHAGHAYIRGNYEMGGFEDSTEGGQMPLPEGIFTLPGMLKQAGYVTGITGKWGLGMPGTTGDPLLQGFDYYYGFLDQKQAHNHYPTHLWENDHWDTLNNPVITVHKKLDTLTATDKDFDYFKGKDYAPAKMTEKALAFIEEHKQQHFFLYVPYTLPHLSLQAPDNVVKKYMGLFDEKPYYGQSGYASTKYPLSTYAAMITYLDMQVGSILEKIKQAGLDNNTLILFSSDNGTTFPAGGINSGFFNSLAGLRGNKTEVYEGGIREPFIVRWPGTIPAGKTSDLIATQYDMMATFAALTHQQVEHTDGISILPELTGHASAQKQHPYIYFEYPEKGGQIAIRKGDWKGVKKDVRKNPAGAWQLYNLKDDRNETTDLASSYPELVAEFSNIVRKEHQHPHIREWEFIDPKFPVKNVNE